MNCEFLFKETLLHLSAKNGHYDVAAFLIENEADVNAKDKNGVRRC